MEICLTPYLIELIYDSVLKSFWRKAALRSFVRECAISENFLATWAADESKRQFLDRLFSKLRENEKGRKCIIRMAVFLAEQKTFPDLKGWEDSDKKIRDAHDAITKLRIHLREKKDEAKEIADRQRTLDQFHEHQEQVRRTQIDLKKLNERLTELSKMIGTQQAGYDFQKWFYDLLDYSEMTNRRPYFHGGRQIDGSLTLLDTTYLVELKFTKEPAVPTDIDSILKKIRDKADNTMGIMVSMSGYTDVAKKEASFPRTPLLLMDHRHLYAVLTCVLSLADLVARIRRHASQTCEAYLEPDNFG